MPEQCELQNICSLQHDEHFFGKHTFRQEICVYRLCELLQMSECPAWKWFPNNAEIKKLAEYLVSNGVTFKEEAE